MDREFKIALSQEYYSDIVYLSQYDTDYNLVFTVMDKYANASGIDGFTAKFTGTRNDTLGFTFDSVAQGNTVAFEINTSLTAIAGTHKGEIVFYDTNGLYFGTANVQIIVEPAARPDGTIDADVERAQEIAEQVQEIVDNAAAAVSGEAEKWATGQIDGTDVPSTDPAYENNAKYYAEQAETAAESIGIDATLTQAGKAADAKKTGDEINSLKEDFSELAQDIIDGKVSIGEETEEIQPSVSDFRVSKITPKDGVIVHNSTVYMKVNGVGNSYYPLISTDYLSEEIKAIQSLYADVKFVLFVYDKTSSEYLGVIYKEYTFKSKAEFASNNDLFPYTNVDMDTLRTMFPTYKFKLEITDVSVNHDVIPTTSDITNWCKYTVPRTASQRQLVKTVNGIVPNEDGDIQISSGDNLVEVPSVYRFENGKISTSTGEDTGQPDPLVLRSIGYCRIPADSFIYTVKTGYKAQFFYYDSAYVFTSCTEYKNATSADLTEELAMSGDWIRIRLEKISGAEISVKEGHENFTVSYNEAERLAEKDINTIAYEYVPWGMFPKTAVLGDSFAYGTGTVAWLDIICKRYNIGYTKYADGGNTTRRWLDATSRGLSSLLADEKKHLYLINFGINDKRFIDNGEEVLGSLEDINLTDFTQNPDTFYGNYGRIIGNVQAHSPKGKIIVLSVARLTERSMDTHIKAIADKCGVPYIQLTDDSYFESSLYYSSFYSAHPKTYGYAGMASAIDRLVRKCIVDNLWYFGDYDGSLT